MNRINQLTRTRGFTVTELVASVAIMGIISTAAVPRYISQLHKTRQNECSAVIAQVMTSTMGFSDEFSEPPSSWADLNTMSAIMKTSGTASQNNNFSPITLSKNNYKLSAIENGQIFTFECIPTEATHKDLNVLGCLNLFNGASEIKKGNEDAPAKDVNCT